MIRFDPSVTEGSVFFLCEFLSMKNISISEDERFSDDWFCINKIDFQLLWTIF